MRTTLLGLTLPLLLASLAVEPAAAMQDARVLFLGNSYTNRNNLPGLVEQLAASLGRTIVTDKNTPGGNTLGAPQSNGQPHRSNATSLAKIAAGGWDFVVLQEQSYLPTIPFARNQYMLPGAASLVSAVEAANPGAEVVLYQTWGRRDGGQFCVGSQCSPDFADFDAMQDGLSDAYRQCQFHVAAASVPVTVANVGEAWRRARSLDPSIVLHAGDGSHPSQDGSYLAACVFYTRFFGESPVGASFDGGLGAGRAQLLQEVAAAVGLCGPVNTMCPPAANSVSAQGASMTVGGSSSLSAGDLSLSVSDLPPQSFGIFVMGAEGAPQTVGDGFLCVGSGVRRIAPVVQSSSAGIVQLAFDTNSSAMAAYRPLPGDEVVFQLWYRDVPGSTGTGFNLSGGISVVFCP